MKGDLSDTGIISSRDSNTLGGGSNMIDQQEDSFQKMYSKELDLDEGK